MAAIDASQPDTTAKDHRAGLRWADVKENLTGYLFIAPALIIIALFGLFPIGYAIYMSLFRWRVRKGEFLGLGNYEKAIGDPVGLLIFVGGFLLVVLAYWLWNNALKSYNNRKLILGAVTALLLAGAGLTISFGWKLMLAKADGVFLNSLIITVYYALGSVPIQLALGMILAYLLYQNIRGKEFFRMLFFLPYVTPVVATAVVFRTIFSPRETAIANQFLGLFGIPAQDWLFEPQRVTELLFGWQGTGFFAGPSLALVSIIIYGVWSYVGYDAVIFLAGLGSIPGDLYEAAEIDGANKFQQFRYITLPLLSPVTFYLSLIAFIGTFKAFNHIYVMRHPTAQNTVDTASLVIFDTFYKSNQFGYAAAQAILLFLIILALTQVQNKVFGERVFYG
ncbi:MAG: hypothetical protein Kow00124_09060 [Anaerolineae bacterium]